MIDRAAILGMGRRLEVRQALGLSTRTAVSGPILPTPAAAAGSKDGFPSLDEAMADHIRSALTLCAGRVEGPHGAAVLLAMNPHTLRARMRRLGVDWAAYRI